MKHLLILLIFITLGSCDTKESKNTIKNPSEHFPKEKAKVLVVGSFHFDYPGFDYNKTSDEDKIDVLKDPKKSEVTELVAYIKKFKPNKIAIEASAKWDGTAKLRKYNTGEYRDQRDERFQLGVRIASELKLDTLYAVNAWGLSDQMEKTDSTFIKNLFKDYDFKNDDPYTTYMTNWFNYESKLASKVHLLDLFKSMNTKESHDYGYGAYLVGDFKLDNYRGADVLAIWWYSRNLRIFRNIQEITESKNDRILVIIGNGHASILRQLLETSPEYDFIEFDSL